MADYYIKEGRYEKAAKIYDKVLYILHFSPFTYMGFDLQNER